MYFNHRFKEKPQGKGCGWVQKSLKQTTISIEDLANALVHGASFKPAVLTGGNKSENWAQQQLFGLDFDNGISIEEAYNKVISLEITPCFVYTTFSHKEDHHKFRMVFCNDTVITNGYTRDRLQATLMGVIGGIDEVCFNRDRLFFGGKGQVVLYPNYDARINAEAIIEKYWNDDYTRYISNSMPNKKQKIVYKDRKGNDVKINEKNNVMNENLNVKAISTLDVPLLQEILGLAEVKVNTNKEDFFYQYSLNPQEDIADKIKDGVYHFSSEAEVYEYINSIDLHEYLGVPSGKFCCILPNHEDTDPSAHIYITDDGTHLYKCFGCNQARTIISITEQLARCKRHEAINFIKKVYHIDYKPSEWVEHQRQLMVDSALYLDSQEFKETFPQINKLIRTRKTDIQKILMHMTKYVSEDMQLDGKPLFFASLTSLLKVCEKKDKTKISQSITLFALLNMLNKVELNCIPEEELKKAKQISAKYGFKKIVNFYQVEEYGFTSLDDSEKIANTLLDNNITLKGLSREYVLRTFGVDLADKVFPQYKFENQKGTSEKSDNLTNAIALKVIKTIEKQGYILEKDINTNGSTGMQWKKSIQEIMDSYGLKKVKANKALKEQYHIESDGYPNIIVKDTI